MPIYPGSGMWPPLLGGGPAPLTDGSVNPSVWPVEGQQHLLSSLLAGSGVANWRLDLYVNDRWPLKGSSLGDLAAAGWAGYSQATPALTAAAVSGVVTLQDTTARNFANSSGSDQVAYGWFLWDTVAGKLVFAKRLDAAPLTVPDGQSLDITASVPWGEFTANRGRGNPIVALDEGWLDVLAALLSGTVPAFRLEVYINDFRPSGSSVLADFTLGSAGTVPAATPSLSAGFNAAVSVLADSAVRTYTPTSGTPTSYGWVLRNNTTGKAWLARRNDAPVALSTSAPFDVALVAPFGPRS